MSLAAWINVVKSECANACNGHGKCTSYDMCICNRNWQANDCSERICQFGLAHVDTPKGDLDMSGTITNAAEVVADNSAVYPYGTTEQFPQMVDSELNILTNSAHGYMECSNKGTCNRQSGTCDCYDGYDGVACQRASCPNSCSGHGVCKTIAQLAYADNYNIYKLWDKDSTMGCECDAGYYGPDCSQRTCKTGVDPLYMDDSATVKYSGWNFATIATSATNITATPIFTDGTYQEGDGYWAIRFYDSNGEDWLTEPIKAGATCDDVVAALEALPNNVIPDGSLKCTEAFKTTATDMGYSDTPDGEFDATPTADAWQATEESWSDGDQYIFYRLAFWEAQSALGVGEDAAVFQLYGGNATLTDPLVVDPLYNSANTDGAKDTKVASSGVFIRGYIYRVHFFENPGALKQPEIEIYLDGKRPSLVAAQELISTTLTDFKVITKVWTDGQQGEDKDYFADHCDNVAVTITHAAVSPAVEGGTGESILDSITAAEDLLLRECLGGSDFNADNNLDIQNWDHGNEMYPHLIKLVRATSTYTDGGYYAVLWYDDNASAGEEYKLVTPFQSPSAFDTDEWEIYTTKGVLALTHAGAIVTVDFASKYFYTSMPTYDTAAGVTFDGDLSCENGGESGSNNYASFEIYDNSPFCLNKTDIFTIVNWDEPHMNPPHINLYTAERLYKKQFSYTRFDGEVTGSEGKFTDDTVTDDAVLKGELNFMTNVITTDISSNWGVGNYDSATVGNFKVYKFFPDEDSTYEYVAECSNRGLCNTDSGLCECFPGYTNDNCDTQNSIAL